MIPGLEDRDVEFYVNEKGLLKAIYDGKCTDFKELPEDLIIVLDTLMHKDKTAYLSLCNDFNLESESAMLEQYIKCCFPIINSMADLSHNHKTLKEPWDCSRRSICNGFGKVCAIIKGPNGLLTERETDIFFLTCQGKLDKEIAEILGNTLNTIDVHQRSIRKKLGLNNRTECILYAVKIGAKF